LTRVKRLDDVYNLVNRVSKPNQENEAPDLGRLGRACEAAGLLDEARGWFALAIARDPLDSDSQKALRRLRDSLTPTTNSAQSPHPSLLTGCLLNSRSR
jgi:hypothetical protein